MTVPYLESPSETDFPLIDRCIVCGEITEWQPRFNMACRPGEHNALLASKRPLSYVPEARVVKICASCVPNADVDLKRMIRQYYPVYAAKKGI